MSKLISRLAIAGALFLASCNLESPKKPVDLGDQDLKDNFKLEACDSRHDFTKHNVTQFSNLTQDSLDLSRANFQYRDLKSDMKISAVMEYNGVHYLIKYDNLLNRASLVPYDRTVSININTNPPLLEDTNTSR